MSDKIVLNFNSKPSLVVSLFKAFQSRKSRFISKESIPEIHVKSSNFQIKPSHLELYNTICEVPSTETIHLIYPFTLVNPYLMRILCREEMPFSQFKLLNTRNRIKMIRVIFPDEIFQIECFNSAVRIVKKGIEFDFNATLSVDAEKVWEITSTYFIPGNSGDEENSYIQPRLESINNSSEIKEWIIKAENRFKFAGVSGDTNGIHYSSIYARMFGFKRDFAQPIRVLSQCISNLAIDPEKPVELLFFIKGPVYYNSILKLKNQTGFNSNRFDLYCGSNERPCISGELVPINE